MISNKVVLRTFFSINDLCSEENKASRALCDAREVAGSAQYSSVKLCSPLKMQYGSIFSGENSNSNRLSIE